MKVENMTSNKGNDIPNQFIITTTEEDIHGENDVQYFQSYDSVIVRKTWKVNRWFIELDRNYWDYSVTTGKYRNQFLGENKAETQKKIDSGEYILADLN